jgi:holin-like protein
MQPDAEMPIAFLVLMVFEILGELLQTAFRLPVPGPVIGMFLLAPILIAAEKSTMPKIAALQDHLKRLSHFLLSWMGLFFVPAGAGLLAEKDLLAREWFPILAAVAGSTIISMLATGLVMHFFLRPRSLRTGRQLEQVRP